jgi:hypothetical protein
LLLPKVDKPFGEVLPCPLPVRFLSVGEKRTSLEETVLSRYARAGGDLDADGSGGTFPRTSRVGDDRLLSLAGGISILGRSAAEGRRCRGSLTGEGEGC